MTIKEKQYKTIVGLPGVPIGSIFKKFSKMDHLYRTEQCTLHCHEYAYSFNQQEIDDLKDFFEEIVEPDITVEAVMEDYIQLHMRNKGVPSGKGLKMELKKHGFSINKSIEFKSKLAGNETERLKVNYDRKNSH